MQLDKYCKKVMDIIVDTIITLDENYGKDINVYNSLGGCKKVIK